MLYHFQFILFFPKSCSISQDHLHPRGGVNNNSIYTGEHPIPPPLWRVNSFITFTMVALKLHDHLIAVTTETKPLVLKNCEEISLLYPKERTTEQQAGIHKENSLWWNTGRQPPVCAI